MQLMALNALLLFDAIFIFFLFLVSVSCLLYYLPLVPPSRTSRLLLANMSAADIESALAQAGEGGGLPTEEDDTLTHDTLGREDETGLSEGCTEGGLLLDEEHRHLHHHHQHPYHHHHQQMRRECDGGEKSCSSLYLHHHHHLQEQQSTVIVTDPTTHIFAPDHQSRAAKYNNKDEPPVECV